MSDSVLNTKIQYFEGKIWKPKPLGEITLKDFIRAHKAPKEEIKTVFNKIAEAEQKEDWETKGKLKQENLFYFTPCVELDGLGRSYSNIVGFNGIMVLDFDHLEIDADEFRDRLFDKFKCIITAYKSPSSKGVKALVKIPVVNTVGEFKEYFYGMCCTMENVKSFDFSCANSVLPLFISWDENIRWREDPETWVRRGGKYDEFEAYTGDFEEIEDVTDEDKKEVLRKVYSVIKKADEENIGHQNCVSASCLFGGFVSSGYITYDEAENYLFTWIDNSPYLSTKASTYKKTAVTMLNKGLTAPLYLKKHQDRVPKEIAEKEQNRKKRDTKYYKLCPLTNFNLERVGNSGIFVENNKD